MLHLAIPVLEALYKAWSSRADCPRYQPFASALHAACEKSTCTTRRLRSLPCTSCQWVWICTLTPNITDPCLVLNPKEKMWYFKKHWLVNLQEDVTKCMEEVVGSSSHLPFQELIHLSSKSSGLLWDVRTCSSFSFSFPFSSLFQHPSQCQPSLTYTFRWTPKFHILICPYLPFRTYIALHGTHLFPSFNILFAGE